MKVAGILDAVLSAGGGFHQGVNALLQMQRLCGNDHEFIAVTPHRRNLAILRAAGLDAFQVSARGDAIIAALSESKFGERVLHRTGILSSFERKLLALGVDIAYFVCPTSRVAFLRKINFMCTVWDLSHRDSPEFPEVRPFRGLYDRERFYREYLPAACLTFTDSDTLSRLLQKRYGLDSQRLVAMPFAPMPFLCHAYSSLSEVRVKYQLPERYFFYPAQFWPHKNHISIIEAMRLAKVSGIEASFVFAGGNKGNRDFVERMAAERGVLDRCRFLGFVPNEEIRALYEGCTAVVMPTYFGPTNLPPLEAWAMSRPLIASNVMSEFVGDAALMIRPQEPGDIAAALVSVAKPQITDRLVSAGIDRLAAINRDRVEAEEIVRTFLTTFSRMRLCWQ